MAEVIGHGARRRSPESYKIIGERLGTAGWALFFMWLGYAVLLDVGEGIALLGIGAITLGVQVARSYFGLRLEGFWIVVGSMFLLGGIGTLYNLDLPLFAIVLIVAGVALFASLFTSPKPDREQDNQPWDEIDRPESDQTGSESQGDKK